MLHKLLCVLLFVTIVSIGALENEFLEEYSFGDADKALAMLTPGSQDYYFYQALHAFKSGDNAGYTTFMQEYRKHFQHDQGLKILENRELMAAYKKNPRQVLAKLIQELGLHFNHTKKGLKGARAADYPSQVDERLVSTDYLFTKYANSRIESRLTEAGLKLLFVRVSGAAKRNLLINGKIKDPTIPGIVDTLALILKDTRRRYAFINIPVARLLFKEQLEELIGKHRPVLEDEGFVQEYMKRLRAPGDPTDEERDAELARQRLFAARLSPKFNSLKARLCLEQLSRNLKKGLYNKTLFMEYLSYPRVSDITPGPLVARLECAKRARIGINTSGYTGLDTISSDRPLITDYLEHFFKTEDDYTPYLNYITKNFLVETYAAARILAGNPEPRYFNMLSSWRREELRKRVEIRVLPTTPERCKLNEKVYLDLALKNVEKIYVKIYRINAESFMRKKKGEPSTSFDVLGIAPNYTRRLDFAEAATTRFSQNMDLPELKDPGFYLVDIIGNGKYARALIRKGYLHLVDRPTANGVVLSVLDEDRQPVEGASLFIEGHSYTTGKQGSILLPYSSSSKNQTAVITKDGVAAIGRFQHPTAQYNLRAGMSLDKESVIPGNKARVLIAPRLLCNDMQVRLKKLEKVEVTVQVRTRDGIETSNVIKDIKLSADADYTAEFMVPDYCDSVSVTLRGEVKKSWEPEPQKLSASRSFKINYTSEPVRIMDVYLSFEREAKVLYILGKNGEPIPRLDLDVSLTNRFFRNSEYLKLQANNEGRIVLGRCIDITSVDVSNGNYGLNQRFQLRPPVPYMPPRLVFTRAARIEVPFQLIRDFTSGAKPLARDFKLTQLINGINLKNVTASLETDKAVIALNGLATGAYRLRSDKLGLDVEIDIRDAVRRLGYEIDAKAAVSAPKVSDLRIVDIKEGAADITVSLKGADADTRVHVLGRFFKPGRSLFPDMKGILDHPVREYIFGRGKNQYLSTRDLDPEYMYILFRQESPKYVGNLLTRPGLILNRIETKAVASTADMVGGAKGQGYGYRAGGGRRRAAKRSGGSYATSTGPQWMDFLAQPAMVLFNLKPDEDGNLVIKREDLGNFRCLEVVAVNASTAVVGCIKTGKIDRLATLDLRLGAPMDMGKDLAQRSASRPFRKGENLVIKNRASSDFVVYRTLGELYRYLQALQNNARLKEFSFVTGWQDLPEEEKLAKYSKYACHELHFFIYKKDPAFFKKIIKPYLANKMHKTFLDLYLLGEKLDAFEEEAKLSRLNIFEQILLGRKLKGYAPAFVTDRFEPNPAAEEHAIEAALGVFGLEAEGDAISAKREKAAYLGEASISITAAAKPGARAPEAPPADRGWADGKLAKDMPARAPAESKKKEARKAREENARFADKADDAMEEMDMDEVEMEAAEAKQFFSNVPKTKEYMENNYYGRTPQQTNEGLIAANKFWHDFAMHDKGPFLSANIGTISGGFTELMLVLALTDLPFAKPEHKVDMEGAAAQIEFADNALVFLKEILPMARKQENILPVMVKSRYFYHRDLKKRDEDRKSIKGEFLPAEIYYNDITVVNPSDRRRECDLLVQIPQGAVAFNVKGDLVRRKLNLRPYAVVNERLFFYFPGLGAFQQYPARVYDLAGILASGDPGAFDVKAELTAFDTASWEYIADKGDRKKIMAYLDGADLKKVNLSLVYYLLKDKSFYGDLNAYLNGRHRYDAVVSSYAFKHNDPESMRHYLKRSHYNSSVGWYLDTPLLQVNAIDDKWYMHLEYDPLVIPRAHSLNGKNGMDVPALQNQYREFLQKISHKDDADANDRLQYAYYLLLQNRIGEGMELFAKVKRRDVSPAMQYDYMACYVAFFKEDLAGARKLAASYKDYSVPKWRKLFNEVLTQLDEAEGKARGGQEDSREGQLAALVEKEASLELVEEKGTVQARGQNIKQLAVKLYLIDVETLFSANPFDQGLSDRFSYVMPGGNFTVDIKAPAFDQALAIPAKFKNRDLYLEVSAAGLVKSLLIFSNDLNVQVYENYGRLKVAAAADGALLKKVYVKVYGKVNGKAVFYKDGYTDLRGVFDYASLSSNLIDRVSEYAILILSEKHGSKIVRVAPPKR